MIQFRNLKRLFLCAAGGLAVSLLQPAFAGSNTLTRVGPYGGSVYKVAFHPTDSSIVYATASSGFYRSTDGGHTWTLVNDGIHNLARGMTVHASQPNRVFVVGTGVQGVLASQDAGATLSVLGSSTGFVPSGTDVEYSADGSVLYVSTGLRVYRSTDHGDTWIQGGDIPLDEYQAAQLIVDPTDSTRLYMAGDPGQGFQSTDGGATWQPWPMPNSMTFDLAIANSQPTPRIWAATTSGIQFTDDRGVTWTNARSANAEAIAIDPNNPAIVYAGTYEGLLRTQDNGNTWSNIQGDANTAMIHSITVDPADSTHVLVTGYAGIASSDDSGAHWTSSNNGIEAFSSYELVSSAASDRIYINAQNDGLYALSPEDGSNVPINNGQLRQVSGSIFFHGVGLTVVPGTTDRLLVASGGRIVRSADAGQTWSIQSVGSTEGLQQVINASADGSHLLATTGNVLYATSDGGDTWTAGPAMGVSDLQILASAPSNPQVVYLSGRVPGATSDIILRSTDSGATWNTYNFPGTDVLAIAVDPSNDQTLYVGGAGEIYKSTDGGQTWATLTIPGPYAQQGNGFSELAIDPQNPNIVYAGGGSFITRSVDGGASWQQLTYDPDRSLGLSSLLVDPLRPHNLYAAMSGNGVYELSVQPDLKITATVADVPTGFGIMASYAYRITNAGPFDATNVRTRIQLPDGVTNVEAASSAASCTVAGTIVTCTAAILRTNANADITINARHPTSGDFTVVGTVEGDQPDPSMADNSVTSNVTVAEMTDLSVLLTGSAIITRGEAANLTLRVTNAGPNAASAASVRFELAAGLTIASVAPTGGVSTCIRGTNVLACQLPDLAVGASVTIAIVTAPTTAAGGFTHMATVEAGGTDIRGANNVATAVTTVSDVLQIVENSGNNGGRGGGGGSTSPFMLAALLLLAGLRSVANKFERGSRRPLS